ncbi:MAG: hypothetical protein M3460_17930 [Actinomycetota bacterium]|nr:hypothetical protein [Actinomycetota bacterium]
MARSRSYLLVEARIGGVDDGGRPLGCLLGYTDLPPRYGPVRLAAREPAAVLRKHGFPADNDLLQTTLKAAGTDQRSSRRQWWSWAWKWFWRRKARFDPHRTRLLSRPEERTGT